MPNILFSVFSIGTQICDYIFEYFWSAQIAGCILECVSICVKNFSPWGNAYCLLSRRDSWCNEPE